MENEDKDFPKKTKAIENLLVMSVALASGVFVEQKLSEAKNTLSFYSRWSQTENKKLIK